MAISNLHEAFVRRWPIFEAKTGFTFFPQVPAAVKQQNNPTAWGIN